MRFEVIQGGRLSCRSALHSLINREIWGNLKKIQDFAPLADDPEACYADQSNDC